MSTATIECPCFDSLVSDKPEAGKTWSDWTVFAESAKAVNFGCQFDCNGVCASTGSSSSEWGSGQHNKKGCCADCGRNVGYLRRIPAEAVELIRELYDDHDGFWRPGGCILPHEYRSKTCLTYTCGNLRRIYGSDKAGIIRLIDQFNQLYREGRKQRQEEEGW